MWTWHRFWRLLFLHQELRCKVVFCYGIVEQIRLPKHANTTHHYITQQFSERPCVYIVEYWQLPLHVLVHSSGNVLLYNKLHTQQALDLRLFWKGKEQKNVNRIFAPFDPTTTLTQLWHYNSKLDSSSGLSSRLPPRLLCKFILARQQRVSNV